MPLNFPTSPLSGTPYDYGSSRWYFDGNGWRLDSTLGQILLSWVDVASVIDTAALPGETGLMDTWTQLDYI